MFCSVFIFRGQMHIHYSWVFICPATIISLLDGQKKTHTCVGKQVKFWNFWFYTSVHWMSNQKCILTEMSAFKRGSLKLSKMTKTTYKTLFRSTHLKPFHAWIWNTIWLVDWNRVNKLQIKCYKNGKSPSSVNVLSLAFARTALIIILIKIKLIFCKLMWVTGFHYKMYPAKVEIRAVM